MIVHSALGGERFGDFADDVKQNAIQFGAGTISYLVSARKPARWRLRKRLRKAIKQVGRFSS